jgi:predicted enzyme related to lactoylglutathione lyase
MTVSSIVIPVKDVATATAFYRTALGAEPHTETPYYVGFNLDGLEIGLNPHGHASGLVGPTAYHATDDIEAAVAALVAAGGRVVSPASEVGGGTTVAVVADVDGNHVGLLHR